MDKKPRLSKTKSGFYQFRPLPSDQELEDYYSRKYYQEGRGSYEVSYRPEEIRYFRLKADLVYRKLTKLMNLKKRRRVLDVGCGEGWLMKRFKSGGHDPLGLDYSDFAIRKFHPGLLMYLRKGNIYSSLKALLADGRKFDVILLANVVEHVKDPVELLMSLRGLLAKGGRLTITAPNDFSPLHEHLLKKRIISRKFWICYPDHLNYFNKSSMQRLLKAQRYCLESVIADNPVDLNLLNANSNYINDLSKGKNSHFFRVNADNFLASQSKDGLLAAYEALGGMGVGRNLIYFCSVVR